jgi:putative transposase
MHWLQSILATRFNRCRRESGHLFRGRYKSIPLEDRAALSRVVDYIRLNPVRGKVVVPEQVGNYRWSSLVRAAADWLAAHGGWRDDAAGWQVY